MAGVIVAPEAPTGVVEPPFGDPGVGRIQPGGIPSCDGEELQERRDDEAGMGDGQHLAPGIALRQPLKRAGDPGLEILPALPSRREGPIRLVLRIKRTVPRTIGVALQAVRLSGRLLDDGSSELVALGDYEGRKAADLRALFAAIFPN